MTFPEKRACEYEHQTVNTPSPAALRRTTERQTGHTAARRKRQKREIDEAGRAKEVRAHPVDFVSHAL